MTQAPLFTSQECPPPRRPHFNDDAVIEAAARLLLADIQKADLDISRDDDEAVEDLKDAILGETDG